jgi:hypothetical protein
MTSSPELPILQYTLADDAQFDRDQQAANKGGRKKNQRLA